MSKKIVNKDSWWQDSKRPIDKDSWWKETAKENPFKPESLYKPK